MIVLLQKTKTTTCKFYGKWLYKVSLNLEGCSLYRTKTIDELKEFLTGTCPESRYSYATTLKAWRNRKDLYKFFTLLEKYNTDNYSIRIESPHLDLYTNDECIYQDFSNKFTDIVIHRFEPNEFSIDILNSNKNYIAVPKLPKGRYNYRVYLLPHKMSGDTAGKTKFLEWLENKSPAITCTPAIKKWFIRTDWNWDRRYVLVEDEQTLLMLKLRNSEVVGKIYNFIVSDK
jgi:hypothetical protein